MYEAHTLLGTITYPLPTRHFWRRCSFSQRWGYVTSLEGIFFEDLSLNFRLTDCLFIPPFQEKTHEKNKTRSYIWCIPRTQLTRILRVKDFPFCGSPNPPKQGSLVSMGLVYLPTHLVDFYGINYLVTIPIPWIRHKWCILILPVAEFTVFFFVFAVSGNPGQDGICLQILCDISAVLRWIEWFKPWFLKKSVAAKNLVINKKPTCLMDNLSWIINDIYIYIYIYNYIRFIWYIDIWYICVKQKSMNPLTKIPFPKGTWSHACWRCWDGNLPFHGSLNLPIDPRQRHFQGDALWWLLLGGR